MQTSDTPFVQRVSWNALASLIASAGRLAAGVMLARLLGAEALGAYSFAVWLVEFAVIIVSFGLPQALTRYLAYAQGAQRTGTVARLVRRLAVAYSALSVLAATILYGLVQRQLVATLDHALAWPLALLLALQLWAGLTQAALTGLQQFKTLAVLNAANVMVLLVGQFLGAMLAGVQGAILGTATAHAVMAAAFGRLIFVHLPGVKDVASSAPAAPRLAGFLPYAASVWVAAVISAVTWGRAEIYFLERFSNHTQVGYFAAGLLFSSLVIQAVGLMAGALLPHFSALSGKMAQQTMKDHYRRLTLLTAMVAFPLSLGGMALMPELIRLAFGTQYVGAVDAARLLMLAGIWSFATVGSAVVYGQGDAGLIMRWSFLGAVLTVLGCVWLVPSYGAVGAAAARFAVHGTMIVIGAWLLRSRYGMPFPGGGLLRLSIAAGLCAASARVVADAIELSVPALAAGTIVGAAVYLVALRALACVTPEDGHRLSTVLARLPAVFGRPASGVVTWVVRG